MAHRAGFIHGTGADLNISIGWIPDYVKIVNLTDGDKVYENFLGLVVAFTSGGTTEIKRGDTIRGLTNTGVYGKVKQVILDSGTWAGGDAAGWFIISAADQTGTFGTETVEVNDNNTDTASVVAQVQHGIDDDTEVAQTSTDDTTITAYAGDADNGYAAGFKIGATISENAKLLGYLAIRNSDGEGVEPEVAGNRQHEAVW